MDNQMEDSGPMTRTPAEPLADGEMIEKLVRDAYDEGVEDGMERGFDPTDGVPQWIDSVARIETLRAIAAYNPNDRLREALVALADAADKCTEAPHFIVQPFLDVYRKHGETIAEARRSPIS